MGRSCENIIRRGAKKLRDRELWHRVEKQLLILLLAFSAAFEVFADFITRSRFYLGWIVSIIDIEQ